jgi:hypothetical protein
MFGPLRKRYSAFDKSIFLHNLAIALQPLHTKALYGNHPEKETERIIRKEGRSEVTRLG